MAKEISPSILDLMWRKMRGHISMLQPHMIAVKLGRMGALSLPAGMGLSSVGTVECERPATVQHVGCRRLPFVRWGEARDTRNYSVRPSIHSSILIWVLIKTATVAIVLSSAPRARNSAKPKVHPWYKCTSAQTH